MQLSASTSTVLSVFLVVFQLVVGVLFLNGLITLDSRLILGFSALITFATLIILTRAAMPIWGKLVLVAIGVSVMLIVAQHSDLFGIGATGDKLENATEAVNVDAGNSSSSKMPGDLTDRMGQLVRLSPYRSIDAVRTDQLNEALANYPLTSGATAHISGTVASDDRSGGINLSVSWSIENGSDKIACSSVHLRYEEMAPLAKNLARVFEQALTRTAKLGRLSCP